MGQSYNEYHREYQRKRYAERRAWAEELLGGKCVHCGTDENLHFDHIDPRNKFYEITMGLSKFSLANLEEELRRCQLLCASCHKEKTRAEFSGVPKAEWVGLRLRRREQRAAAGGYESKAARMENCRHGEVSGYSYYRCRCDLCRAAAAAYHRELRQRRRKEAS